MSFKQLLIANRGEIAIRIAEAAADLGIPSLAIYSEDDANSRHRFAADNAVPLQGNGAAAYLDQDQVIALAREHGCDAIHPGYGFLSENADFAARCNSADIRFVGPGEEALRLFGHKLSARELAERVGVPVAAATRHAASVEEIRRFYQQLPQAAMVIKAVAGGGGRGMRIVTDATEIDSAFARCQSEARQAFGNGDVYAEALIRNARHVEVQIIADNQGHAIHLGERDCTLQRRHQKLIEIAPAPKLPGELREQLYEAALSMARAANYNSLGTFEFLVDAEKRCFYFIEANPRLQVEHTVSEAISGVDLVQTQLQLAAGESLATLGLSDTPILRGYAVQLRINMESIDSEGNIKPSGGVIERFEAPAGAGIRVDSFGYGGYATTPNFDSLLAKLICFSRTPQLDRTLSKATRALRDFRVLGIRTNIGLLKSILQLPELQNWTVTTDLLDARLPELARAASMSEDPGPLPASEVAATATQITVPTLDDSLTAIESPLQGTLVSIAVDEGQEVHAGQEVAIVESMKMEHVITAPHAGRVRKVLAKPGETVRENSILMGIEPGEADESAATVMETLDPHRVRPDLQETQDLHALGLDSSRPEAVARRRKTGQRTARENIADLCDANSFMEYGPLVIAAQRARRSLQELREKSPGDGLIGGLATVNADLFGKDRTQCVAMTYDYTVFAGTQGQKNHRKKDRLFELAEKWRLPVVVFAEGGGGRPGETERNSASGLNCLAFWYYARLKGRCPLVSIVSGRCFAGNAVLAGCSDVIIATENSNLGMGGPAMIEGGGLGQFKPEDVGPLEHHRANGVVDIAVKDEAQAVAAAKKYLGYFQGPTADWECADQHVLRTVVPENRLRVYDIRKVINLLADKDSVLELRRDFAAGMITAFARIEGRPVGIVANNPAHLGGAIDSEGADKAARFLQLCNAFDIPVVFLCDTPGIMVGPEAEKTALVRHAARLFIAGARMSAPFFTVVLRKAYGLGAQTMAGGSFAAPVFTVSWPSGEFGGMGLEGAVKLGYRNEIAAIEDPQEREAYFQKLVAQMYELGKATTVASYFDLDEVIDPKDTRQWIVRGLEATMLRDDSSEGDPYLDTW
ncbi:carboxyl transferase domain-containing protein [Gilvimarinus sp. F26214L]|uniref:carboxyl transferase domain-containing protein n=1 Tax=Gilvimarinus sp. DZF01 TaxID=3461371 RepID=UPI0040454B82